MRSLTGRRVPRFPVATGFWVSGVILGQWGDGRFTMLVVTWVKLLKTMVEGVVHDRNFRALAGAVGMLLVVGTLFFACQSWSLIDSFYFSVTTLTTVGYGDLAPEGEGARLATVAYQLSGIGLLVIFLSDIARRGMSSRHGETTDDDSGSSD